MTEIPTPTEGVGHVDEVDLVHEQERAVWLGHHSEVEEVMQRNKSKVAAVNA